MRNLALLNKALPCKWSWHFAVKRKALWRQVIRGKYREEKYGWQSCEVRGSFGVGLWKAIKRDWDVIGSNMVYSVGNGRRVRFWKDRWCGDFPLYTSFPFLFSISLSMKAWVEDVSNHSKGGVWVPRFSKWLNDWEVFNVELFFLRLQGKRVCSDVEDQVVWTKSKDGRFSVKSLYKALESERQGDFLARVI